MYLYSMTGTVGTRTGLLVLGPIESHQAPALEAVFPTLVALSGKPAVALGFCDHLRVITRDDVVTMTVPAFVNMTHTSGRQLPLKTVAAALQLLLTSGLVPADHDWPDVEQTTDREAA